MSYDLSLEAADEVRAAAAKLARKHGCEVHEGAEALLLSLKASDDVVVKLYRALVKLVLKGGGRLHDPQAGADVDLAAPGRLPPRWAPSGPVPGANYKAKVRHFLADHLGPHGFEVRDAHTAARGGEHQTQGVHFVPGTGRRAGHFTLSLYRTFDFEPLVHPHQMDGVLRIERLVRENHPTWLPGHGWLPCAPVPQLERAFSWLQAQFAQTLLPLADETRTIEGVVAAFEAGRLSTHEAFGHGAKNLGHCYRHLGRLADGRARYWAMLDALEASDDPHEVTWARGERDRAQEFLTA